MLSAAIISTKLPADIIRKAFRGSEFFYTLRLASRQTVMDASGKLISSVLRHADLLVEGALAHGFGQSAAAWNEFS